MRSLTDFFSFWRTLVSRDHEVVDAVVLPAHRGPSPELRETLSRFPGVHYWDDTDGTRRLILIRPLAPPPRERWWLHATLFAVTFVTVWIGGAFLAGAEPFAAPRPGLRGLGAALGSWLVALRPGLEFAMGLMAILLAHETGHYLTAKRYGLNVSPPFFLPAPPLSSFFFVGTFGAFIRLRSPVVDRRQLLDVGAAGPWAGFVVAGIVLVAGLLLSRPFPTGRVDAAQLIMFGSTPLYLGDSLIMAGARRLFAGEGTILLHPLAFAGWLGLFVTMLNMLPLGQLDGGHVLYGLVGRAQRWIAWVTWFALLGLGFTFWGWFVWAAFTILLGRGRLTHPSVLDRFRPIPRNRRPLGWATVALLVGTFTPVPFYI